MRTSAFDRFFQIGIIPVIEIDSAANAVPLAMALLEGGLPIAEITLRTPAALDSIRQIARHAPEILVGAGTVLNLEQAQAALESGAQYLVSPGMIEEIVAWAQKQHIPMLAGAVTPTEMIRGIHLGLDVLKFFPSEVLGGLKAIQAISDPFPQLKFIATGGISLNNLNEYLQMEKIFAVGGSWMARRNMIAEKKFEEIRQLSEQASAAVTIIRKQEEE